MNSLISIIVPVYDVESYIWECLNSIVNQTYYNIEIIIINDGSTDDSGIICDKFKKNDQRIKVFNQENQGLSQARNKGIEKSNGEYLLFVDSDDIIHPLMVESLYKAIVSQRAEISFCSHKVISENEHINFKNYEKIQEYTSQIYTGKECISLFYEKNPLDVIVTWNKLYKKDYFENIRFPKERLHEDEYITYKIFYSLKKCIYIMEPLYFYRERKGSITSSISVKRTLDKFVAYKERMEFFLNYQDDILYKKTIKKYFNSLIELVLLLEKENTLESLKKSQYYRTLLKHKMNIEAKKKSISILEQYKIKLFFLNRTLYIALKKINDFFYRKIGEIDEIIFNKKRK